METFQFMSQEWMRTVHYKGTETAADACVWLDGGGEASGAEMLARITTSSTSLDLSPDGILGPTSSWVKPWRPNPPDVPLDADVLMLDILPEQIRQRFPSVQRVWLAGYSGGGGMAQEYMRARATGRQVYAGYGVGKRVLHTSMIDAQGAAICPLVPFVLWYGEQDPHNQDVDQHVTAEQSLDAYLWRFGAAGLGDSVDFSVCGTPAKRHAVTSLFAYVLDNGSDGHKWMKCPADGLAVRMRALWARLVPGTFGT